MIRRRFPARSAGSSPRTDAIDMRLKLSPQPVAVACPPIPGCSPVIVDPNDGSDPVSVPAGGSYTCPSATSQYWHEDAPYWLSACSGCSSGVILSEVDMSGKVDTLQLPAYDSFAVLCGLGGDLDPVATLAFDVDAYWQASSEGTSISSGGFADLGLGNGHDWSLIVICYGQYLVVSSASSCVAPLPFDFQLEVRARLDSTLLGTCILTVF